jgi:hypothetical protein
LRRARADSILLEAGNRLFGHGETGLQVVNRIVRTGFIFKRQRPIRGKLNLTERLKERDNVEMAFANDDIVRFLSDLGVVFQVHSIHAVAKRQQASDWVFAAGKKMAAIDAGPDPRVAADAIVAAIAAAARVDTV